MAHTGTDRDFWLPFPLQVPPPAACLRFLPFSSSFEDFLFSSFRCVQHSQITLFSVWLCFSPSVGPVPRLLVVRQTWEPTAVHVPFYSRLLGTRCGETGQRGVRAVRTVIRVVCGTGCRRLGDKPFGQTGGPSHFLPERRLSAVLRTMRYNACLLFCGFCAISGEGWRAAPVPPGMLFHVSTLRCLGDDFYNGVPQNNCALV